MSKVCEITGKKTNNGYNISHSHVRTKKRQNVNLQNRKMWSYSRNCWIKVKISTKGLKSLHKIL
uniref:Large ribosomal subunit protein bL28c n=3 Tax=Gelidium TaxID=2811 RepID=A0A3G2QXU0_9FLOR|nr:ribosomal protein L28 [Gelidium kathyanniae]YP_009564837.1 ribosomal protein L28 [Gelidium coulteri]YP_009565237.1 ribosomal protein L28 [Gelidium sinicola]AYO27893.1 ribosomal protein L28 [Gelidium kathyanniae]QBA96188.1 ribosomal protein L28 [Gelidium coulteri]QBA96588.1 ribosomal protein L28 [Gelidium sinicola]